MAPDAALPLAVMTGVAWLGGRSFRHRRRRLS
jgi:hypothetical protein